MAAPEGAYGVLPQQGRTFQYPSETGILTLFLKFLNLKFPWEYKDFNAHNELSRDFQVEAGAGLWNWNFKTLFKISQLKISLRV